MGKGEEISFSEAPVNSLSENYSHLVFGTLGELYMCFVVIVFPGYLSFYFTEPTISVKFRNRKYKYS